METLINRIADRAVNRVERGCGQDTGWDVWYCMVQSVSNNRVSRWPCIQ
jgi:hypothetical protein